MPAGKKVEVYLEVYGHEENVWGYVYIGHVEGDQFDAHTRVGFSSGTGVWATRPAGYWPEPTADEYAMAIRAIRETSWGHAVFQEVRA